ncbi:MAG: hypothetical protein R6V73_00015 [Anaerolineales bacterium]|jgi:hypothetical protein
MTNSFPRFLPWQLSLFIVAIIYLMCALMVMQMPCEDSLFIGLCGTSKFLINGVCTMVVGIYALILLIIRYVFIKEVTTTEKRSFINTAALVIGLFLSAFAVISVLILTFA